MKNPLKDLIKNPIIENPTNEPSEHSRRKFLFKVALLLNGAVGAVLAVPVFGYLFGPFTRKNSSYNDWVPVGNLEQFPPGETRLGQISQSRRELPPTDRPAHCRAGYDILLRINFRFSRSIAHTWIARCTGSRNPNCSCALAMAACITRMARSLLGPRRAACFNTSTKLLAISL